jgi:hypothetical protein
MADAPARPAIPRTGWALGFVSMFMDISSEAIHALLPLFLTTTLGVSVAMLIETDERMAAVSELIGPIKRPES